MCPVPPPPPYASSFLSCPPPAKCFFPLHSVLYYCQITIPKVKIRSHQLGQKYFMVCGTWSFPWHDPKSLLVLCSATPSLHQKQGEQYLEVILLVVLLLLLVVKQQQYSSSRGHRTRCAEHCSRCLLFFMYIKSLSSHNHPGSSSFYSSKRITCYCRSCPVLSLFCAFSPSVTSDKALLPFHLSRSEFYSYPGVYHRCPVLLAMFHGSLLLNGFFCFCFSLMPLFIFCPVL